MTLEDYATKYVNGAKVEEKNGGGNDSEKQPEKIEVPKNVMWYDRCAFRCKTCDYTVWAESTMNAHIKRCPWLSKIGGKAEMEMSVRNVYKCKICDFAVTHKHGIIRGHLMRCHKMNLADYSEKYEAGQ
jgi:hypothetical protein